MTALAFLSLTIWIYLLAARGGFWRVDRDMLPAATSPRTELASVLAVVPARNEAEIIERTLPFLLRQDYGGPFHVVLVDDASDDDTGEQARRLAEEMGQAGRLTVLRGAPPPSGWSGKVWAMQQGLHWAERQPNPPDFIFFTDADIRHASAVLARLVALAERRRTVLASLMVKLRTQSAAELLLMPAFVFFFRMLYPFAWVSDTRRQTAAAAGGAMLIRRDALAAAGGLAAIRGALIDDCAMGRLMKRHGPIWLGLTPDALSIRPYPAIGDVRQMVARSAYSELRHSPWRLAVALFGLAVVFVVPPIAVVAADGYGRLAGAVAFVLMAVAFRPIVRFYRIGDWRAMTLPVVALFYAWFTFDSALQHWRGRGGAWKGRVQARMKGPVET